MTSTFSQNKNLELPANGDYVNTWNIPVNGDMTIIDAALGGTTSLNATSGSATLTYTQYRPLILSVSGAVSANVTYTIPSGVGGQWIVRNAMTDSSGGPWDLIFASGGGGTSVIVSRGYTTTIYSDGTNISYSDSRLSTAAGSNRQIQYNNNGVLGASSTFVYDTSGNVGIGTASPTSKLVVNGGTGNSQIRWEVSNSTYAQEVTTNAAQSAYLYKSNDALYHVWKNSSSEVMRIDSSGAVGIGGIPSITYEKLRVEGTESRIRSRNTTSGAEMYMGTITSNEGRVWASTNTPLTFGVNNAEAMRIDTSGAINLAATAGGEGGQISFNNTGNTTTGMTIDVATLDLGRIFGGNNNFALQMGQFGGTGGTVQFYTESAERMRIDSNGNLLVGTTTVLNSAKLTIVNANPQIVARHGAATAGQYWNTPYIDSNNQIYIINQNNTGVAMASGATAWSANSDERLKDIIEPITSALEGVQSLRAVKYSWKSDAEKVAHVGLIAQDVQKVLPEIVHSAKLPLSTDETKYLSVAYTEVIPLLVAAIQELSAKNDALEARLAKLENAQ